jgi:hypothetical protein
MKFLALLLACCLMTTLRAQASTITVRADNTGNYTSIVAAVNAAQSNDTIIIDDNAVYNEIAQAAPAAAVTSVTLKAAAGKTPTWNFTSLGVNSPALTLSNGTGWVIEGVKFVYTGPQPTTTNPWTCAIIVTGNSPVITKCTFMGNLGSAIYYGATAAANPGIDVSYCSFFLLDNDITAPGDIYGIFWGTLYTGSFEVEHCTFACDGASGGGNRILVWDNGGGNTIKIKNTIFLGNELGYWCADMVGTSHMSFEYVVSSASAHWPAWAGTLTELGHTTTTLNSMVTDPANGDFSLQPGSPALGTASDGTNIGSWQIVAAAPATKHVRADGTADYTSIVAAINAATAGSTIIIDDSAVYAETAQAAPTIAVTSVTLKAAPRQTPTWDFSALGPEAPALTVLDGKGWVISGIKFVYTGAQPTANVVWTCAIRVSLNSPVITGCTFIGNMGTAVYYSESGAANPGVDVSYCSFFLLDNNTTVASDCYALFWGVTFTGTFDVEHCTFAADGESGGGNRTFIWDNAVGGSAIKVRNSIFMGNELGYWCADMAGTSKVSFEYIVSSTSVHAPDWLGAPVDLGYNVLTDNSMVTDPANGDFSLLTGSPALNAASDGTNIGSWQATVINAAHNWTAFE